MTGSVSSGCPSKRPSAGARFHGTSQREPQLRLVSEGTCLVGGVVKDGVVWRVRSDVACSDWKGIKIGVVWVG